MYELIPGGGFEAILLELGCCLCGFSDGGGWFILLELEKDGRRLLGGLPAQNWHGIGP